MRGAEWTYVPIDVPSFYEDEAEKVRRVVTAEQKVYREQELRKARRAVKATIDGWHRMFRGENGKDYFEVGWVVRQEGWLEGLPKRSLCAQAEKGRPKAKAKAQDPGAEYRSS